MTGQENERLAVVETEVKTLRSDVSEIKADVKLLLAARVKAVGITQFVQFALPIGALVISAWAATH